jgi:hypothetical protein
VQEFQKQLSIYKVHKFTLDMYFVFLITYVMFLWVALPRTASQTGRLTRNSSDIYRVADCQEAQRTSSSWIQT